MSNSGTEDPSFKQEETFSKDRGLLLMSRREEETKQGGRTEGEEEETHT